jgi:16S rRNA (guanine1516-N2)-methyltransferase
MEAGVLSVNFFDPVVLHRITGPLSAESVVKAMGPRPKAADPHPMGLGMQFEDNGTHLIDATAGLGLDAFVLACAGWQVTMVEQSALIHALLEDGLRRGLEEALVQDNAFVLASLKRMFLLPVGDSLQILAQLPNASVIYLDPMFPQRDKSARVKKSRYLLQQLHGDKAQGENLLKAALDLSRKVVVKRPQYAPALDDIKPSGAIRGKTARFDIYAGHNPNLLSAS